MTKLKIYLVRHGQNEDNAKGILNGHRDRPLTELGISQAHQLADHIKEAGLTFDAVYTSPLVRASRTAEIITERLGLLPARESPILIERDFGSMTGKYTRDIEALCGSDRIIKTKGVTYFLDPEGAETFPQLMERARRILEYLEMTHGTGSLLLVCHGDVGKMIHAAYYGLSWKEVLTKFHFGNSEMLLLSQDTHCDDARVFTQEQYGTH